eukprot:CAMPEP_0177440654 /NCGR_PEP_ID=MMETSP0369-20130122/3977_1 /TAXON_ID=447022 ORGANISM="Scrippsiella hangoei-like, Strain SHHI-4" /NCGR_SAMPLE_ID=MMETSP0369 /ASSEMBLY_ACC=CAM_ASM_000364 /LENGTH=410 /DNA_ID=CAMNT_0018912449 /DNA_START=74 /DNA_END=1306 /DNA_ORIENTATION=+
MERGFGRSPTFLVGSERQRHNLEQLQRREQHLAEQYQKNKPLCFVASAYQQTHPAKAQGGHIDADVTVVSPMMVGVADGVSQIAEYGLDPSELPKELLKACEELAMQQLMPDGMKMKQGMYKGPIPLMREAYEATEALGSTTALLAVLDNSTIIHGKLHPMIAVLSIGDCEILVLRHLQGQSARESSLEAIFHTEMQRIDGNAQCPLQICRLDERVDADFDERMPLEVIERGAAVHCVSAYEGDIVVMGSDGVFDNLFLDEIVDICNEFLVRDPASKFVPTEQALLQEVAHRIVEACHAKTRPNQFGQYLDAPIGKGGKRDDTCCVVAEVVEWTQARSEAWARIRRQRRWRNIFTCGGSFEACCEDDEEGIEESARSFGTGRENTRGGDPEGSEEEEEEEDSDERRCVIS